MKNKQKKKEQSESTESSSYVIPRRKQEMSYLIYWLDKLYLKIIDFSVKYFYKIMLKIYKK